MNSEILFKKWREKAESPDILSDDVEQILRLAFMAGAEREGDMEENIVLLSDAYKYTHWKQYPDEVTKTFGYLESRGGIYSETMFYGLQYIIKKYFAGSCIKQWMVDQAYDVLGEVFMNHEYFNYKAWQVIVDEYDGKLPVTIKAVKEGTLIGTKNVLVTIESNGDPRLKWLTNWLETVFLQVWYPISVATTSYQIKKVIKHFADLTSDTGVSPYHLNDFGFRGASSVETAGWGGSAHLVNFDGTDTLRGIVVAKKYYNAKNVGKSVAASEHSTTTIHGFGNERAAIRRFLDQYPTGIFSAVGDSYNIYEFVKLIGTEFKDEILARGEKEGVFSKFVVRPDSGDPVQMSLEVVQLLDQYFGSTVNSKGYKVLNPKVGCIYGDGINANTIFKILENLMKNGYSSDCIIFGMGGALLQGHVRDDQKFAFKCCAALTENGWIDVYKDPITDKGKVSKKGRLKLIKVNGVYQTVREDNTWYKDYADELVTVFHFGDVIVDYPFEEIQQRAAA